MSGAVVIPVPSVAFVPPAAGATAVTTPEPLTVTTSKMVGIFPMQKPP